MKTDNPFSNKLFNHTVPVREEVWEAVEKRLPPRYEEKSFPFFWFMLFASTLISGALMFGIINKKSNTNTNSVPNPSYTLTTPQSSETPESSLSQDSKSNDVNQNSTASLSEKAESTSSNTGNTTTSKASSAAASSSKDHSSNHSSTRNQQRQKSSNQNSKSTTPVDLFPAFQESMEDESMSAVHNSQSAASTTTSRAHHSTTLLPLADVELYEPGEDVIGTRNFKPDPNCYKFSGITGTYYLSVDAFAGPGFSPRSFTAADTESSSYSLARETTESKQYAWSAGARFNFHLQRGWALRL
ncbi:MAG TPA: hypothetical protein VN763_09505, partial [Saprospiraceae bacterium]|nr:hypothetical protein [Saprospiraceae bacterium]